ncbi:uncharacterized protein LOC144166356 [Haemaphysalis longicornis]
MSLLWAHIFLSFFAMIASGQIKLCPNQAHLLEELRNCHGRELENNGVFNKLSELSGRYEEYCGLKLSPGSSAAEVWSQRCRDKHFNSMFYRCWADMLSADDLLGSSGVDSNDIRVYKKTLECEFHVLGIEP